MMACMALDLAQPGVWLYAFIAANSVPLGL
jgi:hypothetical protein